VTTYLKEPFENPCGDQEPRSRLCQEGGGQGEYRSCSDSDQENHFSSKPRGQVSSRQLGHDVAVEERAQDDTLGLGIPGEVRILKPNRKLFY